MSDYSKFNIVYRLQKWMDSVPGQTFLNYAYSWGASIVILGTLFKLTHLKGANFMLFLGMGTEVLVFFISAFDRPFDKTADGRDIPVHVYEDDLEAGEAELAEQKAGQEGKNVGRKPAAVRHAAPVAAETAEPAAEESYAAYQPAAVSAAPVVNSQPVAQPAEPVAQPAASVAEPAVQPAAAVQPQYVPQMSVEEAEALNAAQGNYVEELKKLVDTLQKVNEQSTRLTRDSEEMENLNRTLTGISKVYEMQLKGASQQIGTIDQINEQTRKMAQQIEQLNKIYARMIEAMTVNMRAAAPGAAANMEG